MTTKEIYESIDQSKISPKGKEFLQKVEKSTKGFTIENEKLDKTMRKIYSDLKERKPEALKDVKVQTVTKTETVPTTKAEQKKEPKKKTKTVTRKVKKATGKKKNTKPTRTPSTPKGDKKEHISTRASKLAKKEGISFKEARAKISKVVKEEKAQAVKQTEKELDKLLKFVRKDSFEGEEKFPKVYGKQNPEKTSLGADAIRKAKPKGRRVSEKEGKTTNQYGTFKNKTGRVYYEHRDNRSDRNSLPAPRGQYKYQGATPPYLEAGGTLPTPFGQAGLVGETGTLNEVDLFAMGGDLPQGVHQYYANTYNPAYPTPHGYAKGGKIREGKRVKIADYYREDEVGKMAKATKYATILSEPSDDEELVMVQYTNKTIDYVPQEVIRYAKGGMMQGYNDRLDESLGNRDGVEPLMMQSFKDRRDESKGMEKAMGRRAYQSVGTMDKMAKGGEVDAFIMSYVKGVPQDDANLRVDTQKLVAKLKKGGKLKQGYNDQLDESLGMRKGNRRRKMQNYKDRRDESKAIERSMGRRAYASVGMMDKGRRRRMAKGGELKGSLRDILIKKFNLEDGRDIDNYQSDLYVLYTPEIKKFLDENLDFPSNMKFFTDNITKRRFIDIPFMAQKSYKKGGKIGFDALAKKVAKRYEGKKVPRKFQKEYGKRYSKEEAMEVGDKVASKVYRQQQK